MSNVKPKISVIVPAYNAVEYIDKCLEALVKQTFQDIEIICVNDFSEDKTGEVLRDWAKKDARIRVLDGVVKGLSGARNRGIDDARGEYVMFCDSDDYYEPTTCEELLKAIEKDKADMAICEVNMVYYARHERRLFDEDYCTLKFAGLQKVSDLVLRQINLLPWNKIYRKEILDKYKIRFPEGRYYEDAYFSCAYLYVCQKVYFLRKRLYNYVRRKGSIMSNTWAKNERDTAIDHVYVIIALYDFLKEHDLFRQNAKTFWERFRDYEYLALNLCKSKAAKKKTENLVADFIDGHRDDLARAEPGVRDGIITRIPKLRRKNLPSIKRSMLRIVPTFGLQVYTAERLEELVRKNDRLLRELSDLVQTYEEKRQDS